MSYFLYFTLFKYKYNMIQIILILATMLLLVAYTSITQSKCLVRPAIQTILQVSVKSSLKFFYYSLIRAHRCLGMKIHLLSQRYLVLEISDPVQTICTFKTYPQWICLSFSFHSHLSLLSDSSHLHLPALLHSWFSLIYPWTCQVK